MWHWLVQNGLLKDLIASVISWTVGLIVGYTLGLYKFFPIWDRLQDQLDTSTPGGLTDVVEAIRGEKKDKYKEEERDELVEESLRGHGHRVDTPTTNYPHMRR